MTSGIGSLPSVCWMLTEAGQLLDDEGQHYGALLCSSPSCGPCGELRSIEVPEPSVEVEGQLLLLAASATQDSGGSPETAKGRRDGGVSACFI